MLDIIGTLNAIVHPPTQMPVPVCIVRLTAFKPPLIPVADGSVLGADDSVLGADGSVLGADGSALDASGSVLDVVIVEPVAWRRLFAVAFKLASTHWSARLPCQGIFYQ